MSLLDAVEAQQVTCKVPGCNETWVLRPEEVVETWKHPRGRPPKRMCHTCRDIFKSLEPLEIDCAAKGCEHSITIPPYQQLVLKRKNRPLKKENFFCDECQKILKTVEDKNVPCRIKGCKNTWTWFASSQLRSGGRELDAEPAPRLCDPCFRILQTLSPKKRPCRVRTCTHDWVLDRMTQLELKINNKKDPKRMCPKCSGQLKKLAPKHETCCVTGCDHTWEWSAYSQLEHMRALENNPDLAVPERYCDSCFGLLKRLKPMVAPCSKTTCPNTVEYSVNDQLLDHVQKRKASHHHKYCEQCLQIQDSLTEKEVPCHQEGCSKTWIWSQADQFETGQYQEKDFVLSTPPSHYCERCHNFLHNLPDRYVQCQQCGTDILWTARQQLMTDLELWVAPTLCPNCLKNS